ncbi:MAG: SGNH/GDSL hydrolase family protein [Alphaproteobacteria bacterium]|nr:SGNH/GDSL hydrolase family protein [Alphaproteobacteria bacterium]
MRERARATFAVWLGMLVVLLALRGCLLELLRLFTVIREFPSLPALLVPLRFGLWAFALNVGRFLTRQPALPSAWRAGAVATALVVAGVGVHQRWVAVTSPPDGFFSWGFANPREPGRFPYDPGSERRVEVQGAITHPHIGADGTRVCGPQPPPEGRPRVALIGDSFVYGKGVEDRGTLCWQLRERLGAEAPALINLGQAGANARSYAQTLAWAAQAHQLDAAVVGYLIPDDALPLDLNDHGRLARSLPVQLVGAVLEPELLLTTLPAAFETTYSDFVALAVVGSAMDRLVAAAVEADLPVAVYLYGDRGLPIDAYARRLAEAAEGTPVRVIGVVPWGDPAWSIPGDGHPTAAGNAHLAELLAPVVGELLGGGP